jgi:parvulin-like peptidyl-prolyl isomerase
VLVDRVAATVGHTAITRSEVRALLDAGAAATGKEALDRLIEERLIEQDCKRIGITVQPEEIDAAVKDVVESAKISQDELRGELKRRGMGMDAYRERLRVQLLSLKWLNLKAGLKAKETSEERFKRAAEGQAKWLDELKAKTPVEVLQ